MAVDPRLTPAQGSRVTIGIRPDHFDVASDGLAARLISLESTGAETLAMADLAGTVITIVTRERIAAKPGDPIHLYPMLHKQLYFDNAGQRIVLSRDRE
jgi:multiple sugar transport system ATP-binding protein